MSIESSRLFIAIPIDELWKQQLTQQMTRLQPKLPFQKWTHPEDYHITLKFLGDTSVEQYERLSKLLTHVAETTQPFQLTLTEWGTFGPHASPSILWAGVGGDLLPLMNLQQNIDNSMTELGFLKENRDFHPHLTIARRYKGDSIPFSITNLVPHVSESTLYKSVNEFKLYESHLKKTPMYEPIASFTFSK
ncbi:RNA 2',3'-cyclic phosphodiesterase [Paenibacillus sp. WQ 127069]|uniref:RNA 2',3'-cyclic phosphodiesterase n=1 Tax=Paenibacillus baimaensis TaxID=2982185 RepID=A0ABT2ULN4_9BACL|nr:RNA 2',3'-cyclic phosphodiesterase [Paenibacillus sp. WQ 127069]MCU6795548.1 RNA 2',3'-cyclic phosphodiesterase [Paenibacillus sp. WQ 127069]